VCGIRNVNRLTSQSCQELDAFFNFVADVGIHAFSKVVARDAMRMPFTDFFISPV